MCLRDGLFASAHTVNSHSKLCTLHSLKMICEQPFFLVPEMACDASPAAGRKGCSTAPSPSSSQPMAHLHSANPACSAARGCFQGNAHTKYNTHGTWGEILRVGLERETHNRLVLRDRGINTAIVARTVFPSQSYKYLSCQTCFRLVRWQWYL